MRALANVAMWATIILGAVGLYLIGKLVYYLGGLALLERVLLH